MLSDPEKRQKFDAGEIDAAGNERQQHKYYRDYALVWSLPGGHAFLSAPQRDRFCLKNHYKRTDLDRGYYYSPMHNHDNIYVAAAHFLQHLFRLHQIFVVFRDLKENH